MRQANNSVYSNLIEKLKLELSNKTAPGPILDEIMFRRLDLFSKEVAHDHNLLLIGATLSDIRIDEAIANGNIELHVNMALDYSNEIFKKYDIPEKDIDVITEIISTHHGGTQNYIESKIYKNADNFKFLETRGCFHFFGSMYEEHTPYGLKNAIEKTKSKLDEKLSLTDLNDEVIIEAKELYEFNMEVLDKMLLIGLLPDKSI